MAKAGTPSRYAGFMRGVTPTNCSMPQLKAALEKGGFSDVKTIISSGNFTVATTLSNERAIQKAVDSAIERGLGRAFMTILRPIESLRALLEEDPFKQFKLAPNAKRVVTFLPAAPERNLKFPLTLNDAHILATKGLEVFTAYVPTGKAPDFMVLIEKTYGKDVTTRTWETVRKAAASQP